MNSPDFVPSVFNFPTSHKGQGDGSTSASYDRYKRAKRRKAESQDGETLQQCENVQQSHANSESQTSAWSAVQDELLMAYDEGSDKENGHPELEVTATIPPTKACRVETRGELTLSVTFI